MEPKKREKEKTLSFDKILKEKGLPKNVEAERALLGALIINNDLIPIVLEKVDEEDFSLPSHQIIFSHIKSLFLANKNVDFITLKDSIESSIDGLTEIGGIETLTKLIEGVPHLTNVDNLINILKEKTVLRKLLSKAFEIISKVYTADRENDSQSILITAEKAILELGEQIVTTSLMDLSTLSNEMVKVLDSLAKSRDKHVTGIPTSFPPLDEMTNGFQRKDLILLAARPSVGKTALALNIALNVAKNGYGVAFFSLEMSREQLFFRLISQKAQIELSGLRRGYFTQEEKRKILRTIDELSSYPIFIDDNPSLTVVDIGAKLRRLKKEKKVDLVIIDYLQLMTGKGLTEERGKFENRNQEVAAISRALKLLAKELDLPILALSQLSRAPEKRSEAAEPLLSDLRDSGSLEQDADVVLFLHRPYLSAKNKKEFSSEEKAKAFLIVAKQRNGPTGQIQLYFHDKYTQFTPTIQIE